MNNNLQIFSNKEFGKIRTLKINNENWFIGKDVAEVLGYERADNAIRSHVDEEDKLTHQISASGQNRNMKIINESGLYSLILSSKLPNAKKFKRWVTGEVLPQLRKTGTYQVKQLSPIEQMELTVKALRENDNKIEAVKEDLKDFKDNAPLFNIECETLVKTVRRVATKQLGGYKSLAYKNKSVRTKVYEDIHHQIRREFGVDSYKAIKRCQLEKALEIVESYTAPTVLVTQIFYINNEIEVETDK